MSYMIMCKEALEDILGLKSDGNDISIDSIEMERVFGEEMIRVNLSGDVPEGRVRMIVHRDVKPGKFDIQYRTEIKSHPSKP